MDKRDLHIIEHLEELRKRMIITLVTFILSLIIAFILLLTQNYKEQLPSMGNCLHPPLMEVSF